MNDLLAQGRTIEADVPCRSCGYNLRGLAVDGACPECNAPIGVSLARDELQFANPDWLRRVRRGLITVFSGLCVSIVAAGMVISRTIPLVDVESFWSRSLTFPSVVAAILFIGLGTFLCTHMERRLDSCFRTLAIRRCTRVCAVAMLCGAILIYAAVKVVTVTPFETAGVVSFSIASLALTILFPRWLHELLRRTTVGRKEASAVVASWLAMGGAMCVAIAALSYQFRWEEGAIGAFMLVPLAPLYAVSVLMATWRALRSIAAEERARGSGG